MIPNRPLASDSPVVHPALRHADLRGGAPASQAGGHKLAAILPTLGRLLLGIVIALASLGTIGSAQDVWKIEISEISRGHRFTDGPAWSPQGYLYFVDVPNNRMHRKEQGDKVSTITDQTFGASGIAFDKQGRMYTAEGAARRIGRIESGKHEIVAKGWEGKAFNSPNDIEVRGNGDVYFTDPAYGVARSTQELDFYGVFRITTKGQLSLVKKSETRLNGIAFSPDQNTLYLTDSDRRVLLAMDINSRGEVKNERELVKITNGVPAGICVDPKGNIYVAAAKLLVFDKTGKSIGVMNTPGKPSNCTFGEADGNALFVTAEGAVHRLMHASTNEKK